MINDINPAGAQPGTLAFSQQNAVTMLRNLRGARAMLRAVIVAELAVSEGSINWGQSEAGPYRWSPVLSAVRGRLIDVRDIITNTLDCPSIDWTGCLLLAEAIDAALWHACSGGDDALDQDELVCATQELVSMLDKALEACVLEGVSARAAMH